MIELRLFKQIISPEYEFTVKSSKRTHNKFGIILTVTICKKNIITGEERVYEASRSYLHGSDEEPIRHTIITILIKEMLNDKFGGLEIKETYTDENYRNRW
jgi:hypothetical protein